MPYGFTNTQAGDLAGNVDYGVPGSNYLGFGNNAFDGGIPTAGYGGSYLSGPGSDDPADFQRWLSALGGTIRNGATGLINTSVPVTAANKIGGLFGADPIKIPDTQNTLANYYNPIAQWHSLDYQNPGLDSAINQALGADSSFTNGYGYTGQPNPGPIVQGPGMTVGSGFNPGSFGMPSPGYTFNGSGNGGPSAGFDPSGPNLLPPFTVNDPKYNPPPPTQMPSPVDYGAPIIPPPTVGGFTPPAVNLPPTNPPALNPPTLNPPGIDPPTGPTGGNGIPPSTGTSGDRNAYPEGLAQNYAQSMLAPQQLNQYNQYSGANAAIDARNLGVSLFGAGGPSTIAGQSQALTRGQQDPLLQQQNAIASYLLAQGGNLSASDLRNVQQSSRAGFAARGLDATNASIVDEAMQTDAAQRNRLMQNLGIAQNVVGQNQAQTGLINANNNSLFGLAANQTAASNAYTRNQFDPFNNYGMDLSNTNYNAGQSRQNAAQNNALALTIAGMNADAAKSAATTSTLGKIFGDWLGRG